MEPKTIRVVEKPKVLETPHQEPESAPVPVKKSAVSYEERLEKMSNRQLAGEVRKGVQGKLSGYRAVAEAVVLDVILKSFQQGMTPVIR
jgi:hypothetical protein